MSSPRVYVGEIQDDEDHNKVSTALLCDGEMIATWRGLPRDVTYRPHDTEKRNPSTTIHIDPGTLNSIVQEAFLYGQRQNAEQIANTLKKILAGHLL